MLVTNLVRGMWAARVGLAAIPLALALLASSATHASAQATAAHADQAQVHEALYQEIYGRNDQRQQQLEAILAADPEMAAAHWQMGHVKLDGQWQSVDEVIAASEGNVILAEYAERRAACGENPAAHRELAIWCRRNDLVDRERYHWQQVLVKYPQNEEARRALGLFYSSEGVLMTRETREEEQELKWQWRRAENEWRPVLARHRRAILHGAPLEKQEALAALAAIEDEWCLPTLEDIFSREGGELALAAVGTVTNIQHPWATRSLLRHALLSEDEPVRRAAIEALADRPFHEFVPQLIEDLQAPLLLEFSDIENQPGVFSLRCDIRRETPEVTYFASVEILLSDLAESAAKRQQHESVVASFNQTFAVSNERIIAVLANISGRSNELTPREWFYWWCDYNVLERPEPQVADFDLSNPYVYLITNEFYMSAPNPDWTVAFRPGLRRHQPLFRGEFFEGEIPRRYIVGSYSGPDPNTGYGILIDAHLTDSLVGIPYGAYIYDSQAVDWPMFSYYGGELIGNYSCFAAGTPVWTDQGLKAIETILPGDRVLSQNVETGELAFKLVTECTVREPTEVFCVVVAGETVVASGGHPFWVSGQGWRMVRELNSGDALHGLAGAHLLSDVLAQDRPQAVYNLVVEDNHNYFVGDAQLLVHDVTMREPTQAIVPGLIESP